MYSIMYKILKEHEKIGMSNKIIPINRKDIKKTMIALKTLMVSVKAKSKDARLFFKKNYKVIN